MPCVVVYKEGPQHAHSIEYFFCLMGQLQTAISQRVHVVVRRDKAHSRSTSKEDSKTAETASRARNVDVWFWPYLCTVITLSFWCHWSQKMTSKESPSLVESSRHLKLEQLISRCEVICRWNDCFCVLCKNILLANYVSFGGKSVGKVYSAFWTLAPQMCTIFFGRN